MSNILFDESHYFMCTGGLKPCRMKSSQNILKRGDGNYYLTETSLTCKGGEFSCRMMVVLAGVLAGMAVLLASNPLGWVILAAIAAAASPLVCGVMAAFGRSWMPTTIKDDTTVQGQKLVANRPGMHLTCVFGTISYVPNVTREAQSIAIFAVNFGFAGLEGFMYAYAGRGVGLLINAPKVFAGNFAANYIASLSIKGVAMRTAFAGLSGANSYFMSPEEGANWSEIGNSAKSGFFFLEQAPLAIASNIKDLATGEGGSIHELAMNSAMLLSLGGLPGGKYGRDATGADVVNTYNKTLYEWKHPVETAKASAAKAIDAAREFKAKISKFAKGAHEMASHWKVHQSSVTKQLEKIYGEENVLSQVRVKVSGIDAKGNTFKNNPIVVDNLIRLKNGKYKVVDAKWSEKKKLGDPSVELRDTFTKNQKPAYEAIGQKGQGSVTSAEVRGRGGEDFGFNSGDPIPLEKGVDIYYDTPSGAGKRSYP